MLLEEEAHHLPVTLEHNAYVWEQRGKAISLDNVETEFTEGTLAYAVKQARMYREIKAMAETRLTEAKLANGKKRVWRQPTYEDILVDHDDDEGGEGGEDAWDGNDGEEDERGDVFSDEEFFLGGEDEAE
jgi:hypothetical protein